MVDPDEACDDGNGRDGDGCSSSCEWEAEPIAMPGGSIRMVGSPISHSWERVTEHCMLEPGAGDYYRTFPIVNATGDLQRVRVRTSVLDRTLVLAYDFPFDGVDPEAGCIVGEVSWTNRLHPTLYDLPIQPNQILVIVVSTFTGEPAMVPPIVEVITEARPGDGIVGAYEACDDGNTVDGDGCSGDCRTVEDGWTCAVPGAPCTPNVCGDGLLGGGESCDDGNPDGGDGCSASCTVEAGYACPIPGQDCRLIACGDGFVDAPETCDEAGPGCDASCRVVFFDTANAEKMMPVGATIPLGRWATRIMDQQPWVYTAVLEGGRSYVAELFVGGLNECNPTGGPGYSNAPNATLNIGTPAAGFAVVDSDDSKGPDGCPRFEFTPGSDGPMSIWIYVEGPGSTDPMFIRFREVP